MRSGMHVSGSAIDRVFAQPIVPPRRFRGAIDAVLTLALGSVCAFGLTLGPAPLNTVTASSAAAASFSVDFDPVPGFALLPSDVDDDSSDERDETPSPGPSSDAVTQSPAGAATTGPKAPRDKSQKEDRAQKGKSPELPEQASKGQANRSQPSKGQPALPAPKVPQPQKPSTSNAPELISPSAALSVVQDHRLDAGLSSFISADACAGSTVYGSAVVTPSSVLAPGVASRLLAPDPAYATVSGAPGAITVTVHACE